MLELKQQDYERVRPLIAEMATVHVSIGSLLDGYSPGFIAVDDANAPTFVFVSSPEGEYMAGEPPTPEQQANLAAFVQAKLFGKRGWQGMYLTLPPGWPALDSAFPRTEQISRRYYICTELALDWRAHLPDGYEVRRLDCALLTDPDITHGNGRDGWKHMCNWMIGGWFSMARFLRDGFGFVTLHDNEIVSYSLADGRSGDECEIGIHTVPTHRRRGLAAITAAAAVEHALADGYRLVGWHCNEDNSGSWHTAERVGFVHATDYEMCKVER